MKDGKHNVFAESGTCYQHLIHNIRWSLDGLELKIAEKGDSKTEPEND